jgi:tetratricopeptide (TPR) repeat protein
VSLLLALLLQVGPNPLGGGMAGDDIVRDRPERSQGKREQPDASSAWLQSCLDQLEEDAARAHSLAQIRRGETRGTDRVLANHCLGMAATELALWDEARAAFIAARDETPGDETRTRARFGAMAGNAALAGGDAEGALGLLTLAEADARAAGAVPLEAIAATDRARALVRLGRGEEALNALESATGLAPDRIDGWLLKATLLRRLERLSEAQSAIERASALVERAPAFGPEIALEAGVIALLDGREDAARRSWQSVVALAPDTPFAETARDYLAQLGPAGETAPQEEEPQP